MNGKNTNPYATPEFLLGAGCAVCGLLVLLIGVPLAHGRSLVVVVLIGLMLLTLGAYMIWELAAPWKPREAAPLTAETAGTSPTPGSTETQPASDKPAAPAAAEKPIPPAPATESRADDRPAVEAKPAAATEQDLAAPPSPADEDSNEVLASPAAENASGPETTPAKRQCSAHTKAGARCKLMTDHPSGLCHIHRAQQG